MDTRRFPLGAGLPLAFAAAGLAVYLEFASAIPDYTVFAHAFRPRFPALLAAAAVIGLTLIAFEVLLARVVSRLTAAPFEEVLRRGAWTLLPLVATALAPVTLVRYIGAADVALRSRLLLGAAVALAAYLKIAASGAAARAGRGQRFSRPRGSPSQRSGSCSSPPGAFARGAVILQRASVLRDEPRADDAQLLRGDLGLAKLRDGILLYP
jgi:hypothetical protein